MSGDPPAPAPGLFLGPFLIGTMICAIFFGLLCLQCYGALRPSKAQCLGPYGPWLIVAIWSLNAFNLFAAIWSCYLFMITRFGWPPEEIAAGPIPWSPMAIYVSTALSNSVVQGWFVWRIRSYAKAHGLVPAILGFGVMATCCLMLALAGKSIAIGSFNSFHKLNALFYVTIAADAITNLGITVALSLFMSRKRRSPLYSWDYLITAPVIYMSNAGIFCLTEILLTFILRIARPNDFMFFGFLIPYSTLYANALLGFLNTGVITSRLRAQQSSVALRSFSGPASPGRQHDIHADMERAMDIGSDSQVTSEMPLTVRVERIVEDEKQKTAL